MTAIRSSWATTSQTAAYPFYVLLSEAQIDPRLDMESTVRAAVEQEFQER